MVWRIYIWTDENIQHLAEHDVTQDDFEAVLDAPVWEGVSGSSGLPACIGIVDGRRLFCVYEIIDEVYIHPITAYEIGG